MSAPILETVGLTKRFGGFTANDDISMAVEPGEVRGIIGPNGAGKSTFINLMTGVHPPTSGEVRLQGKSLVGLKPHEIVRQGLARSFQVAKVFGNLTLVENLLAPVLAQAKTRAERDDGHERAWRLLELTGLARLAANPAMALSGGQRVLLQAAAGFMVPSLANYLIAEKYTRMLQGLATAPNQKVVVVPIEMTSLGATVAGIGEIAKAVFAPDAAGASQAGASVPQAGGPARPAEPGSPWGASPTRS